MSDAVEVLVVGGDAALPLARLRDAAARAQAPLLWLRHPAAEPDEQTLPALLADTTMPAASVPVDGDGNPIEAMLGRFVEESAPVLDAALARRLPLRHAPLVSLLVEREVVLRHAAPDPRRFGGYAGDEWTARVFAEGGGVLVPDSRVRFPEPAVTATPLQALRTARAGTWTRGEALRELGASVSALRR
jgi:hypothetical protein